MDFSSDANVPGFISSFSEGGVINLSAGEKFVQIFMPEETKLKTVTEPLTGY